MARRGTTNMKVRACLLEHNIVNWQLAEILKIVCIDWYGIDHDCTSFGCYALSVYMRYEWPDELQNIICDIIEGEPFDELKVWAMLRDVKPKTKREQTAERDEEYYIEKYADHIIRQVEFLEQEKDDERNGRK